MAVAFVSKVSAEVLGGASTISLGSVAPTGSDRFLIVSGGHGNNPVRTLSSITKGATSITDESWAFNDGGYLFNFCRHLINPSTSSETVTVTFSGVFDQGAAGACWFTGAHQTTAVENAATDNSSANINCDITITSATGDMVFDTAVMEWQGLTTEDGAADNERWAHLDLNSYTDFICSTAPGAASAAMSYTKSGGDYNEWTIGGLNIIQAAAGGATPKGPLGHPLHGPFAGPVN